MTIIDRRPQGRKASEGNRQRFLKKYKKHIKEAVDRLAGNQDITNITKKRKIVAKKNDLNEPNFQHDPHRGKHDYILAGNETLENGDTIYRPPADNKRGTEGDPDGDVFDDFVFTLTKEEFIDTYFSDMELPDYIKQGVKGSTKLKLQRAGYTKEGVPARLDLFKTLKQSIARRKATNSKLFLTDADLRYKYFKKVAFPIKEAVVFLLMDVSASMDEVRKTMGKKFFLLLYLFLTKTYDKISVRFIRHAHMAEEVAEKEFFYEGVHGGTIVSTGLSLINDIITKEIALDTVNVYIAQASDGENSYDDTGNTLSLLTELLQKVQYFIYVQIRENDFDGSLLENYSKVGAQNLSTALVTQDRDIYPALRDLFKKKGAPV